MKNWNKPVQGNGMRGGLPMFALLGDGFSKTGTVFR